MPADRAKCDSRSDGRTSLNVFVNSETLDARFLQALLFLRFEFAEKVFLRSRRLLLSYRRRALVRRRAATCTASDNQARRFTPAGQVSPMSVSEQLTEGTEHSAC